ncbi:uncharacterized protein G2W53_014325 [Senna tora]|uniref:Uncharacterized protein n=1 Tax=Senna tora TaxID=362788 RepID=A0A835C7U1_9FABA|nr:uncharacterized protein G2W53_014325 [Senna tora]
MEWEERGSCLNIFQTTNRGRISETYKNYEAKDLMRRSFRIVLANRSDFHAPIGVVLAWEERGSCLNIIWTTNRSQISVSFTKYEAKDLFRKTTRQKTCCAGGLNTSVRVVFANPSGFDSPIRVVMAWEERGSVLTYSGRQIAFRSQKPSRITRQKNCCASESNTSVRVVFANRSFFDTPIGVFLAWEERGSCLNIFRTTNRDRISETFRNYEAKHLMRKSADLVLTYFGRQIMVGSQNLSRITRQKTCCASEPNTSVRIVFANRSGFDAPNGVVLAWEERGSCLDIFQTINRGQISETFMNYEAKDLLRKISETFTNYEEKDLLPGESNTLVRIVFANRCGFDAPIAVDMAWEERGSCINIFRTTNRGRISETFTNYEAKDLLRNESNKSVRVVFANRSAFHAPIAVDMAWEERGSCINIFRMINRGRISETFTNYEAKDMLRK